ncbi:hypothetical protein QQF64_034260 [Cirrhinus molitorella]|uniref:Uncharacterized protein n=1 Tax=Cirrhinus molitorella TaxID=172907 RepID=A0ABR3MWA1_9TELE
MDTLKPPENLKLAGNVDSNWCRFQQHFELYMAAIGMDTKADERKVALLLTIAGPQAIEVYNTFVFGEEMMLKIMSPNADATIGAVSFKGKRCMSGAAHQKDAVYSCKHCGTEHKPSLRETMCEM